MVPRGPYHSAMSKARRRRRRRTTPEGSREALLATFKKMGLSDQVRKLQIFALWGSVVGPRIAKRTEPFTFSRGVLTLKVQSAAWQNELTYLEEDLLKKINTAVGERWVTSIRIVAGAPRKRVDRKPPPLPPLSEPDRRVVESTAAEISDPDVRACFRSLMEKEARAKRRG